MPNTTNTTNIPGEEINDELFEYLLYLKEDAEHRRALDQAMVQVFFPDKLHNSNSPRNVNGPIDPLGPSIPPNPYGYLTGGKQGTQNRSRTASSSSRTATAKRAKTASRTSNGNKTRTKTGTATEGRASR